MKNSWFNDVFMPSIFARCGVNNFCWLTIKQVAVCRDYFKNNSYVWNGRMATLTVSRNGAGKVYFALTTDEATKAQKSIEIRAKEKDLKSLHRLYELRNKNDRASKVYHQTLHNLQNNLDTYQMLLEEAEIENNSIDVKYFAQKISETKEKINILLGDVKND
jgi:hypothetical protein